MPLSRQEKIRPLLENFVDGSPTSNQLMLKLYPSELDRFKSEFPQLKFVVVRTTKTYTSKQYGVKVTRQK